MKLHEAIIAVLQEKGHAMSFNELADEINKKRLYSRKKDNLPLPANQVSRRVRNQTYAHLFSVSGQMVRLSRGGTTSAAVSSVAAPRKPETSSVVPTCSRDVEQKLMKGLFVSVADLESKKNLGTEGLYCIRLRPGVALPSGYSCKNEILYIGVAKKSLRTRLWGQELHADGHGTFFRSVGAMLGFRPPKGSLRDKVNKENYKFSSSDEREIIKWLERSVRVNCIEFHGDFDKVETELIQKYTPLLNIAKNPEASELLRKHRAECREIALA